MAVNFPMAFVEALSRGLSKAKHPVSQAHVAQESAKERPTLGKQIKPTTMRFSVHLVRALTSLAFSPMGSQFRHYFAVIYNPAR